MNYKKCISFHKNYIEYKREVITDPDGNVSYGNWFENRRWR